MAKLQTIAVNRKGTRVLINIKDYDGQEKPWEDEPVVLDGGSMDEDVPTVENNNPMDEDVPEDVPEEKPEEKQKEKQKPKATRKAK